MIYSVYHGVYGVVSGKPDYSLERLLTKGKDTQCSASNLKWSHCKSVPQAWLKQISSLPSVGTESLTRRSSVSATLIEVQCFKRGWNTPQNGFNKRLSQVYQGINLRSLERELDMRLCNSNLLELLVSLGVLHCTEKTKHLAFMHIIICLMFSYIFLSPLRKTVVAAPPVPHPSPLPLSRSLQLSLL